MRSTTSFRVPRTSRLRHPAVARPRDVIPQEGRPALPVASGPGATHVPLDGSLADADTELEQLAAEALRAPARIACGHLSDECRARCRGSTRRPRAPPPERAEACPVPAEDGRRLDEQRGVPPRRRHACGESHREALPRCPPGPPRELSLRHDELLPEQRVLGDETGAAAPDVGGQPHREPKDVDHAARRTAASARIPIVARTGSCRRSLGSRREATSTLAGPTLPLS
jgi:hypothetical protein